MRISDNMRFLSVQRSLSGLRSRQAEVMNQITSGRRVLAPSTDPVAAAELTRLESRLSRTRDFKNTIDNVRADASLSEATLEQASGLFVRAKELAVQGANDTLTAEDRAAIAIEVRALKEQLVAVANTRGSRGYLFSGSQTNTATLSTAGAFQGDDTQHRVEIAPGVSTDVTVSGSQAFTAAGGTDAFAALDALEQALLGGDGAQVSATLTDLESSRAQITRVRSEAGLVLNRLDTADEALSVTELELQKRQAALGEVDPFDALSELTRLSTALEQAIGVARLTLNSGNTQLF